MLFVDFGEEIIWPHRMMVLCLVLKLPTWFLLLTSGTATGTSAGSLSYVSMMLWLDTRERNLAESPEESLSSSEKSEKSSVCSARTTSFLSPRIRVVSELFLTYFDTVLFGATVLFAKTFSFFE